MYFLVTQTIYVELLLDLTSHALIATFNRFVTGCRKCSKNFTDNARSFVGANSKLKKFYKIIHSPDEILENFLISEDIDWKSIPS